MVISLIFAMVLRASKFFGPFYFLVGDGDIDDLAHVGDIMEAEAHEVFGLDLGYVLAVLLTEDDFLDSGPFGGQDLFLDSTHGQYLAPEGDLPRHGQALFHLALGEHGRQGGQRGGCGAASSLWRGP